MNHKSNRITIKLRGRLCATRRWTRPVEHCMFHAVQVPTNAFIHFELVCCNQYIVCSATGGCPEPYCSCCSGRGGQGRCSPMEQCVRKSLRGRRTERTDHGDCQKTARTRE